MFGKNNCLNTLKKKKIFKIQFYNFLIKIPKCMPNVGLYLLLHRHTLTYTFKQTDRIPFWMIYMNSNSQDSVDTGTKQYRVPEFR